MSYIPIEYNNYACFKLKEFIYPYVVLDSCDNFDNFGLSDLVKLHVSTCKNRNFVSTLSPVKLCGNPKQIATQMIFAFL